MSMPKWICITQFHAKHLKKYLATRSSLMCAERHRRSQSIRAVRQAVNSRRSDPDREGPPTECATSIPRNDQAVQVGWSSMSTGNVGVVNSSRVEWRRVDCRVPADTPRCHNNVGKPAEYRINLSVSYCSFNAQCLMWGFLLRDTYA